MENKEELKLLRARSMASVVSDGYRLYMSSFRQLFRSSWIVAIVYALAFALMMGTIVNYLIPMQTTLQNFGSGAVSANPSMMANMLLVSVSSMFYLLASALLAAQAVHVFREHSVSDEVSRPQHWYGRLCLKAFVRIVLVGVWLFLLSVVIEIVFYAVGIGILAMGVVGSITKSIASIVLLFVLFIIVAVLTVPLAYTVIRALMDRKLVALPPVKGYGLGMRHWGMLFAVAFIVAVFTWLLSMVCELPAVIMTVANAKAYAGLALGDPLGMPDSMVPMTYCVFTVAGFIQAYVHLSSLYPFYYAYGSIELQQQERQTRMTIEE